MTLYTDMPSLIEVGAKDFGGTRVLTSSDLDRVTARVVHPSSVPPNEEILEETDMIWNAETETWQLLWYTPLDFGTYMAEIQGYGIGEDKPTSTYKRVRVARRPFI